MFMHAALGMWLSSAWGSRAAGTRVRRMWGCVSWQTYGSTHLLWAAFAWVIRAWFSTKVVLCMLVACTGIGTKSCQL